MHSAKCTEWKAVFIKLTRSSQVQRTGLKNSLKCKKTSTLLHHSNSNLTAQPLGAPDRKYNIFSLVSTIRSRNMLIYAGDLLSNEYQKITFSCWISQGSMLKTWLSALQAPKQHPRFPSLVLIPCRNPRSNPFRQPRARHVHARHLIF